MDRCLIGRNETGSNLAVEEQLLSSAHQSGSKVKLKICLFKINGSPGGGVGGDSRRRGEEEVRGARRSAEEVGHVIGGGKGGFTIAGECFTVYDWLMFAMFLSHFVLFDFEIS